MQYLLRLKMAKSVTNKDAIEQRAIKNKKKERNFFIGKKYFNNNPSKNFLIFPQITMSAGATENPKGC